MEIGSTVEISNAGFIYSRIINFKPFIDLVKESSPDLLGLYKASFEPRHHTGPFILMDKMAHPSYPDITIYLLANEYNSVVIGNKGVKFISNPDIFEGHEELFQVS